MKVAILLLSLYAVTCRLPTFENPEAYTAEVDKVYDPENPAGQKYTDTKPLGYTKQWLPHPPNAGRPNPVYEIKGLDQRQIELRVETIQKGATLCVRDNDEGPDICSQGSINQCYMASKDTLRFEFYCTESCQSSDVNFFFRFIVSEKEANDLWCTNRPTDGYPSDLKEDPPMPKINKPVVTPAPQKEGGSSARTIVPAFVLLFLTSILSLCFY